MVEKQKLEKKIGEVLGLEMSAQKSIEQLSSMGLLDTDNKVNKDKIQEIKKEAADHQRRIEQAVKRLSQSQEEFDSHEVLKEADDALQRTTHMMDVYLKGHEEPTAALEFLCLAEAGEVTHYELLNHIVEELVNNDQTFSSEVRSILDEEKQHLQECIQAAKESVVR